MIEWNWTRQVIEILLKLALSLMSVPLSLFLSVSLCLSPHPHPSLSGQVIYLFSNSLIMCWYDPQLASELHHHQ